MSFDQKREQQKIDINEFKKSYHDIGKINSPALKEAISFNSKGLNHIFFSGSRRERSETEFQSRMRLFPRAVELLKKATTISGYLIDTKSEKPIHYWEFIGIIDNRRIRVIVRQLGTGGLKHFWSIIPAWMIGPTGEIINASGKIAKDIVGDLPSASGIGRNNSYE